jgi:hypothetical protein
LRAVLLRHEHNIDRETVLTENIAPAGVAAFIAAQFVGMLAAVAVGRWLWKI